jgi:Flp pilus assembly protein TadG
MVLPLLLFVFVGFIDFGLIIREHQVLQNGARDGARFSVLRAHRISEAGDNAAQTAMTSAIKDQVVNYLQQENITITRANVTVDQNYLINLGTVTATASRITVTYLRSMLIGNGWPFGPVALKGEAIFRNVD